MASSKSATAGSGEDSSTAGFAGDLVKNARDIAFIAAIFLYFTGFAYRYYYLTFLEGVQSVKNGIPVTDTLVDSYSVLYDHRYWIVGAALILLLAGNLAGRSPKIVSFITRWRVALVAIAVVALFPILNSWASSSALAQIQKLRTGEITLLPSDIAFKDNGKSYPPDLVDYASSEAVYIVGATDDMTFVLYQKPTKLGHSTEAGFVYAIPNKDIVYTRQFLPEIPKQ